MAVLGTGEVTVCAAVCVKAKTKVQLTLQMLTSGFLSDCANSSITPFRLSKQVSLCFLSVSS